jgi:hypothetical protein
MDLRETIRKANKLFHCHRRYEVYYDNLYHLIAQFACEKDHNLAVDVWRVVKDSVLQKKGKVALQLLRLVLLHCEGFTSLNFHQYLYGSGKRAEYIREPHHRYDGMAELSRRDRRAVMRLYKKAKLPSPWEYIEYYG